MQIAFLAPYPPDLNTVEYLGVWLKRHALTNYCPNELSELHMTARNKLKSAQKRPSIIAASRCRLRFNNVMIYGTINKIDRPQRLVSTNKPVARNMTRSCTCPEHSTNAMHLLPFVMRVSSRSHSASFARFG